MAINLGSPVNTKSRLNQGLKIWSSSMVPGLPIGSVYRNLANPNNNGVLTGATWAGLGPTGGANSITATSSGNVVTYNAPWLVSAVNASFACWIYRSSSSNQVNLGTADIAANNYGMIWYTDGNVYFDLTTSYSYCALAGTGWHHIVECFDGSQSTDATRQVIYIDGIAQTMNFVGGTPTALGPSVSIFRLFEDQPARYGVGNIADFRQYDRTLSATEAARIYTNSRLGYQTELNRTRNSFITTVSAPPASTYMGARMHRYPQLAGRR